MKASGHEIRGIGKLLEDILLSVFEAFGIFPMIGIALSISALFDSKRYSRRLLYLSAGAVIFVSFFIMRFEKLYHTFDIVMAPLSVLGPLFFILTKNKDIRMFKTIYLGGTIYALCVGWTSNTGISAVSMGLSVSSFASIVLLFELLREMRYEYTGGKSLIALVVISTILFVQFTGLGYIRYNRSYWDLYKSEITETIELGVAKGIKTTKTNADFYNSRYKELRSILHIYGSDARILILPCYPWEYIATEMRYASYNTWGVFGNIPETFERELDYYKMHPEMVPDVVVIFKDDVDDVYRIKNIADSYNYKMVERDESYIFVTII